MPNPVVSFEIRGPDPEALRTFYRDVFGWDLFIFPGGGYTGIETTSHSHDDATGTVTYTGADAFMNDGVLLGSQGGQPAWKFKDEPNWRAFQPGLEGGGIFQAPPAVTVYIQVPDLDEALAKVARAGGSAVRAPEEVAPNVHIATFKDPAGNEIGLTRAPSG